MLARWRARKAAGQVEPFVLFPQGTTCAVGTVCEFQPRVAELLAPEERLRPVAVDIVSPLPFVELRGLGGTNVSDLIWWVGAGLNVPGAARRRSARAGPGLLVFGQPQLPRALAFCWFSSSLLGWEEGTPQ
jgi:hypothetical protein